MFPTFFIVDADLMMSVPQKFTAYHGIDTFYHAAKEEPMFRMAKAMRAARPVSKKNFIRALDGLIASVLFCIYKTLFCLLFS